ncbi:hypothetical protein PCASD_10106 [Puccinia coronata f. sp. avenae]|uniref:Uncharacterized protein n=1 Tax=Puccinia coronata f. sp. avenae TaxID=200324 RepID=A0A2N5UWJ6_9BASI|nr:hypothetical protein PCASD_10106 [Puccinia coronata f. sp. avenae]
MIREQSRRKRKTDNITIRREQSRRKRKTDNIKTYRNRTGPVQKNDTKRQLQETKSENKEGEWLTKVREGSSSEDPFDWCERYSNQKESPLLCNLQTLGGSVRFEDLLGTQTLAGAFQLISVRRPGTCTNTQQEINMPKENRNSKATEN